MQMKLLSRLRITAVMAVAFTAEHADSMVLSAMYLAIGDSQQSCRLQNPKQLIVGNRRSVLVGLKRSFHSAHTFGYSTVGESIAILIFPESGLLPCAARSLDINMTQVGTLSTWRAIVQVLTLQGPSVTRFIGYQHLFLEY